MGKIKGTDRTLRGLVSNLATKTAKNGQAYSEGDLTLAGGDAVHFRLWDCDISQYPVSNGVVADVTGYDDEYNGVVSFIVAVNKGIPQFRILPKEDVNKYVVKAPYNVDNMYDYLVLSAGEIKDEALKKVSEFILKEYKDKLLYYPYSHSCHNEKGGMLYHLTTCVGLCRGMEVERYYRFSSGSTPKINKDTIIASIIASCVGFLESDVVVNSITGLIESRPDEEMTYSLYGSAWNTMCVTKFLNFFSIVETPSVRNMLHCISYERGIARSPLTAEAVFYKHLVREELEVYAFAQARVENQMLEEDAILKI